MSAAPTRTHPGLSGILEVAAQVEAAEARIKQEIAAAAERGDCGRVVELLRRWMSVPATEVLADGPH